MVLTPSNMMTLGTQAPDFTLPNINQGGEVTLHDIKSDRATVIVFMCNHCPFVKHIGHKLGEVAEKYTAKGIQFIAINANDIENYPEDAPEHMVTTANEWNLNFPYLYDETQAVAKAYDAACTPDFFVFDKDLKCVYRGRFDGARPGNDMPVTGEDLSAALDAILAGEPVSTEQQYSMGCNIKWRE